jgi:hypothetical protein
VSEDRMRKRQCIYRKQKNVVVKALGGTESNIKS